MGDVLKKFGRYFLLDHVGQGGMAEIYRARLASKDGAGRLLVIKRIQAGHGSNSEFIQMFRSEIKVTMGFNHPNIVQVYDFGEEHEQPYIAMEFVDGRNLRQFSSRFAELKQPFPVELAAHIVEQAACGLQYAHAFKDKITGQPLSIVHRDISPQNILISYEGTVKVIDFGIAKAATNVETTRAGVIKGKPSYLSPEQISGEPLDGRSDIFSLGTVLWEILTGKKLFAGESDLAVLKLIEACSSHVKPPSTLNPRVPKQLDYIVLRALAKQRDKRFQSAEEFQRALHKFLYSYMPEFNPSDLGYYAKELFKEEIVDDRKKIQKLNDEAEKLLSASLVEIEVSPARTYRADTTTNAAPAAEKKKEDEATMVAGPQRRNDDIVVQPAKTRVELSAHDGVAAPRYRGSSARIPTPAAPAPSPGAPVNRPRAPQQRIAASPRKSGGFFPALVATVLAVAGGVYYGPSFGLRIPGMHGSTEAKSGAPVLELRGNGTSGQNLNLTVNGKPMGSSLPATLTDLPAGIPLLVSVTGPEGSFEQKLTLQAGERKTVEVKFPNRLPAEKAVRLRLDLVPADGKSTVTVNGKPVVGEAPILQVPLDSPLELFVEREGFKPLRREFVLDSAQVGTSPESHMDVVLEPLVSGELSVTSTPSAEVMLYFEGKPWWKHPKRTPIPTVNLPPGNYELRLVNDALEMEKTVPVVIQKEKSVPLEVRLSPRNPEKQ